MVSSSLLPNSAQPREVCFPAIRAKVPNYKVVGLYKSRSTHSTVLVFNANLVYLDTHFLYIEIVTISKYISFFNANSIYLNASFLYTEITTISKHIRFFNSNLIY